MTPKTPLSPADGVLLQHAREMRREMTAPERRLWSASRRDALGVKVRRQVPLGSFIADFYVPAAPLVIEVDGMTHDDASADAARDAWLAARGVVVLRVTNADVTRNLDGVVARVVELVEAPLAPPPQPSPARGEGDA
ncbi:endonuclease domain-containing protein [Falsiroseomonas oryziterrae]|uniref:endonuclease domain-containing protein n=1 Tax=Falsiroseomonas oryziterrae TaxID=2911368 RepID=UPI001F2CE634|nr:DUF559 domain-containing protein [Roseomonas sp. NPKOSM-4]